MLRKNRYVIYVMEFIFSPLIPFTQIAAAALRANVACPGWSGVDDSS